MRLSVRELQLKDISLVTNYWATRTPEQLMAMGVETSKFPSSQEFEKMLTLQTQLLYKHKSNYALIWEVDGKAIGHCNVNAIEYGNNAFMHLHVWIAELRKIGIGTELVKKSLPFFFKNLKLKELFCQPYALNPAPNKTLAKTGFKFVGVFNIIPGPINFKQNVNKWVIRAEDVLSPLLFPTSTRYNDTHLP